MPTDVVELFLGQVAARPDHAAVVDAGRTYSYGEIGALAGRLAGRLSALGPHPRVAIHAPAGAFAYAAMMATLMAGGIYTPLNVSAPPLKRRRCVVQFRPDAVISTMADTPSVLEGVAPCLVIDPATVGGPVLSAPRPSHDLAYVMFTSGSTGAPKGVMVGRAALANYVGWALRAMAVTPDDRWSQHPNIGFDLSVLDIYGALCGGATLYPLDDAERRFMAGLAVKRHGLTIWNSVPSVVDLMVATRQLTADNMASLRLMTFCGEALLPAQVDAIFAARPDLTVHNTYGPTEATVSCTLLPLRAGQPRATGPTIALGQAIDGMAIHLVGGSDDGEGEIVIAGPQLAAGYWEQPEATARQFRMIDLGRGPERAYFTGDWGERRDGHLFFRRRIDTQTKISGYRVELDEINAAIRECGYTAACVVAESDLHAFVETIDPDFSGDDLAERLVDRLEPHLIPRWFHRCEALPRNANDKVDLGALIERLATL